jgi:hypothetical protein
MESGTVRMEKLQNYPKNENEVTEISGLKDRKRMKVRWIERRRRKKKTFES